MKVAIYARVSTADQDEQLQIPRLQEYAARAGWEISGVYSDVATGKNCDRPGWAALMSDARRRNFDRILITKLDRMMRSVRILLDELESLRAFEVKVFTLDAGLLDLDNPGSRLLLTVLGSIAEWEGETISQRTKDALAARKARGERLGRPPADIPIHKIALLRLTNHTWENIAFLTGLKSSTIRNHMREIHEEMEKIRDDYRELCPPEMPGLEVQTW